MVHVRRGFNLQIFWEVDEWWGGAGGRAVLYVNMDVK